MCGISLIRKVTGDKSCLLRVCPKLRRKFKDYRTGLEEAQSERDGLAQQRGELAGKVRSVSGAADGRCAAGAGKNPN